MALADMVVDDTRIGSRTINAAALNAMLIANPGALTSAAIAAALAGGGNPAVVAGLTNTGDFTSTPFVVAAAGATQGNATAITGGVAILVTVTNSAKGAKLPAAVTGRNTQKGRQRGFPGGLSFGRGREPYLACSATWWPGSSAA